ncbi:hypothetical protein [Dictyobacter aurantiacus]|uniref:hypothetical protein n=1 Tax=Dictyobacter aurantiacus TaxID=1936993 RepID=UPI000F8203AE|nr:hypothetical protein [Dictyobacter aurantiacus]
MPDAMESDRPLPLIETALERLRSNGVLAPNMIRIERLVWEMYVHNYGIHLLFVMKDIPSL